MDSEEIAYGLGHEAYYDGKGLRRNPYQRKTIEWEQWRQGWNDEKTDNPYWEKVKRIQREWKKKNEVDSDQTQNALKSLMMKN